MTDDREHPPPADEPAYRVYRSGGDGRGERPPTGGDRPYRVYRAKPRGLRERLRGEDAAVGGEPPSSRRARRDTGGQGGRRVTTKRVVLALLAAIAGWLLLSLVLFLISAQIEQGKVNAAARSALTSSGFPLTSANTVLVLGSDQRVKGTKEPGANTSGPSRSDTIMLWRVGGGHSARLSIPRDTVVDIPGHGRAKINAAYAYGGAALSIRTIEQYLGIPINHLVEVNFANFPQFVDALGGVDVKTGRVCSDINGGTRNGGYTLNLHSGTHHLDGKAALALARTRKNRCNPAENDLTRAKRQQQILSGIKGQLLSPGTFFRLPWVSWTAPKAIRTDMGGISLLGLFGSVATTSSPPTAVLKPDAYVTLPDGESALHVSDAERRSAVQQFLAN
jgi:LCP family protein required for cell wall assembly